jgi:hypothetical protein
MPRDIRTSSNRTSSRQATCTVFVTGHRSYMLFDLGTATLCQVVSLADAQSSLMVVLPSTQLEYTFSGPCQVYCRLHVIQRQSTQPDLASLPLSHDFGSPFNITTHTGASGFYQKKRMPLLH